MGSVASARCRNSAARSTSRSGESAIVITADFAAASSRARSALDRPSPTNAISGSSRRTSSVAASRIRANDTRSETGRPPRLRDRTAPRGAPRAPLAGSICWTSMLSSPESSVPIWSSSSPFSAISAIRRVGAPAIRSSLPSAVSRPVSSTGSSMNAAAPARSPSRRTAPSPTSATGRWRVSGCFLSCPSTDSSRGRSPASTTALG